MGYEPSDEWNCEVCGWRWFGNAPNCMNCFVQQIAERVHELTDQYECQSTEEMEDGR